MSTLAFLGAVTGIVALALVLSLRAPGTGQRPSASLAVALIGAVVNGTRALAHYSPTLRSLLHSIGIPIR